MPDYGVVGEAHNRSGGVGNTQLSENLLRELGAGALEPTPGQLQAAAQVVASLAELCWACVGPSVGAAGELLPIGAHALGVASDDDTVDLVYIAPEGVQIADLLAALHHTLQLQGATGIADAGHDGHLAAPGLRFQYRGVEVRLFLSVRIPGLPQPCPQGIVQDTAGVLAREVVEQLMAVVPSQAQFRFLLRVVRTWAKRRGIYGGHLGFFTGTSWAICCARVCQANPGMELSQLVMCFFRTLTRWDWRQPFGLLPQGSEADAIAHSPAAEGVDVSGVTVMLPVGTGLAAQQSVTETTMTIMLKELRRGLKVVQQVEAGRTQWTDVFATARFFQRHRHYLELDFMATSADVFHKWLAWSVQQLASFVPFFEATVSSIVTLRPWPEMLDFEDSTWPHARAVFIGLHLERGGADPVPAPARAGAPAGQGGAASAVSSTENAQKSFDLREPVFKFLEAISAWPEAQQYANQFEVLVRHVRLGELEQWLEQRKSGLVVNNVVPLSVALPGGSMTENGAAGGNGAVGPRSAWTADETTETVENVHCSL